MPIRQRRVVKLDLHVDDVRDPRPHHRRHVLRVQIPPPTAIRSVIQDMSMSKV